MGVVLRAAVLGDLSAIFDIYHEQVLHGIATFDTQIKTEDEQHAWLASHQVEYPAIVAVIEGGLIVGWATLSPWSPRRAYDRTAEVSTYVHKDHRGRGVGSMMLADIIGRATNTGRKVLLARIAEPNPASVKLYESAGFWTVGMMRGVGEKFGRVLDVRMMQREI